MHFDRYTEDMAISDCGYYSVTKEEPVEGCPFRVARFHPEKSLHFGQVLGYFYKYGLARQACVDHKREKSKAILEAMKGFNGV